MLESVLVGHPLRIDSQISNIIWKMKARQYIHASQNVVISYKFRVKRNKPSDIAKGKGHYKHVCKQIALKLMGFSFDKIVHYQRMHLLVTDNNIVASKSTVTLRNYYSIK